MTNFVGIERKQWNHPFMRKRKIFQIKKLTNGHYNAIIIFEVDQ